MSQARTRWTILLVVVVGLVAGVAFVVAGRHDAAPPATAWVATSAPPSPAPVPSKSRVVLPAVAAPAGLPTISYTFVPAGFPADPDPSATTAITEGLHPHKKLPLYDKPGGKPRAFLPPSISGVEVTVPIVAREPGWVAVLVPSVNRRIGWLPIRDWEPRTLHDHILVRLSTRQLAWLRDGVRKASWTVAIGAARTPTPLGRTFVLGRTGTRGAVYEGLDALVLGAVPDDKDAVAPGLEDAHTGIHAWARTSAFGRSVSNGCLRMPRAAQLTLLANIGAGTLVTVVD
jgi:hypothetical protein